MFVTRARNGRGKNTPLLEAINTQLEARDKEQKAVVIDGKERYFTEVNGELEHAAQPYRNRRSLNQGMRDLEKLAVASMYRWEEVGEGMWTFDPTAGIWYSLGGKLELPSMEEVLSGRAERVRHNFIPYDISALSEHPQLFHIHPEGLETFVAPPRESLTYHAMRDDITKFLSATPSRADYRIMAELIKQAKGQVKPHSFIVHSLGVTEFTYPTDIGALEEMGQKSRDIRDQVMLSFDVGKYIAMTRGAYDRFELISILVEGLNRSLPQGFNVRLHPVGTNF